jgi:LacI family transcriptional regulator
MKSSGSSRPTIQDVARLTGLSIATVSRALHTENSPNVSGKTRERVRATAAELGYQTNLMGRSLVKGRSHTISYWTQSVFSAYYMRITEQICFQADSRNYHVIINSANDPARNLQGNGAGFGNPFATNYDGIIACDIAYGENHQAEQLVRQNMPFVGIGQNIPPQCDSVQFDIYVAGQLAVKHLWEAGASRIAILTTLGDDDPRLRAYLEFMTEAAFEPQFIWLPITGRPQGRDATLAFVIEQRELGRKLPEAIFCKNDETAMGCYRALCELGVRVPEDILLIGCDGLGEMAYQACSLSSVSMPFDRMCELAWDMLEERIADRDAQVNHVILRPELIIRESSQSHSLQRRANTAWSPPNQL